MDRLEEEDLWTGATSIATLIAAWEKVRANKGVAGGDGVTIDTYARRVTKRLTNLSQRLATGEYAPGPYRRIDIPKKKGGLRRLMVPTVEDRIAHTAIAITLTPWLEPLFEESSFAYRPGRSVKQAVAAIERWRDAGYIHVIEADIVSYFDAVRHDKLLDALSRSLQERKGRQAILDFVGMSLDHQGLELGHNGHGLAQGSPLSPLLANLYLDVLDEEIHASGVRIVRFADDFVILCKKRRSAEAAIENVRRVLASLGLELHDTSTRIIDFDRGFEFLGYLFVRSLAMEKSDFGEDIPKKPIEEKTGHIPAQTEAEMFVRDADKGAYARGARVLYVMERGRQLTMRNNSFSVLGKDGKELVAIAHHRVDRIEVGAGVPTNSEVLDHCLSNGTDLIFTNGFGEIRGRLINGKDTSSALQLMQAKICLDPHWSKELARAFVDARIRNQRTQLFRLNRRQMDGEVKAALIRMGRLLRKIDPEKTIAQLRGIEGAAAAEYWPALATLCVDTSMPFRRSRPARDPLNATINYFTAILERDVKGALQSVGLHPGFGALHAANDYSEAAVYDLMEPFRASLTEGLAVFLFNAKRLHADMFEPLEDGHVRISRKARSAIIVGYEQAVAKRINIPGTSTKLAWRRMMQRQALDLAKAIRDNNSKLFKPYLMEA